MRRNSDSPFDKGFVLRYPDGEYSLEVNPPVVSYNDSSKRHTVKEGDTLQNIAFAYYGDSGKWYLIAEANNIINPLTEVKEGLILIIPNNG